MKDVLLGRVSTILLVAATSTTACQKKETVGGRAPRAASQIPSFQVDVLPVLAQHCASAEGCHGDQPTDSVPLDLRPGAAYGQLVGARAHARKGGMRVRAGDPGGSFIVAKLIGTLGTGEGKTMPIDARSGAPLDPSPLPPDFVEKVLSTWILAGAPNN